MIDYLEAIYDMSLIFHNDFKELNNASTTAEMIILLSDINHNVGSIASGVYI